MIEKTFKRPDCKETISFSGQSGERKTVYCPYCRSKGIITFPKKGQKRDYAIEVSNLKKVYGDLVAVDGISFHVNKGEIFAFLGPNGAGKTTTVEMIESIRQTTTGTIKILGADIKKHFNNVKDNIGILPQEFHSFDLLTVRETLDYFAKIYKKHADIDTIIDAMDLRSHEKQLYKNLSGGLKQRVGVAMSLVNNPDIVFLDEPTTGLDPKARREVWMVIADLKKKGKTVFLTTHYMEEAEFLADRICILHKGKIIAEGSLENLIERYGNKSVLNIKSCKTAGAIELLCKQGYHARTRGNGNIAISIEHKERVLEILSYLRHECIDYESIDIRRSNLEEVFLTLTGAKLSEEQT